MKVNFKEPTTVIFDGHRYECEGELEVEQALGEHILASHADNLVTDEPKNEVKDEPKEEKKEETKETPKSSK